MINKKYSLKAIAEKVNAELHGDSEVIINGVSSLADANNEQISFLGNKKYASQLTTTKAAAVIVPKDFNLNDAGDCNLLITEKTNEAFAEVINLFAPPVIEYPREIHPAAVVADSAKIGENCHIGACVVIGNNVVIGDDSVICAGTAISDEVIIGNNVLLYSNVSIRERCVIGNKVIIHPGTAIGSDGFGYEAGPTGIVKIPQVGIVQIDDDVEIGANCTIDRARFGKTYLKMGVKLDNMVHIAHNVVVGEFSMLIGQCGIAGSTKIGKGVIVAAQAGINGHITLGDGSVIGGASGVAKDVPAGETVIGVPAESKREFMTRYIMPKTVAKLKKQVKDLEKQLKNK